ncbi:hypothetical protein C8E03_107135 [Lachnotalea glycerini]|uniref:Uncharacterized protein n=1 Tax=Lachnotalea glycerini TaxID=1763509 RepID=A0A318EQ35_9FIRM|nr:hypothetical protein [Lachnotalea glycerini]PXV89158.1 hypothetical protein C8E03_107135 [Lachnotalea glycerini]
MFKRANENFIIPDNAVLLTEEEMMEVEGGGFKAKITKKIVEFIANYIIAKGVDYLWEHRKAIWDSFVKGLEPTDATKATAYYKTFSQSIPH